MNRIQPKEMQLSHTQGPIPVPNSIGEVHPPALPVPHHSRVYRHGLLEYGLPILLLAVSVVTTTAIGARFMQNFQDGLPAIVADNDLWPWPWLLEHPARIELGWPFSVTLLGILLIHEFGHYFACRAHGIRATLPWVLPAPTLSGTAGAVIRLRSPIPTRQALMDVGVYGPLAGYVASLAAVTIGFLLSRAPAAGQLRSGHVQGLIAFGKPLTLDMIHSLLVRLHPATPSFELATRHPVLIAGWIGLFITSLNLIPCGQLDGGHILYALSSRWHRVFSRTLPFALLACGFFFWVGWIFWGLLLLIPAMRHPRVPIQQPLNRKYLVLSALALVVFALTFSAKPLAGSSVLDYLR
jgi:membrane-associated protease RseP (regulator of RpoE activity)